ncbi:GNAT family N-acetyltransferase [Chryseobacterium sp. PTM-20240506]|uniref:GNAT family N-acetyltransferase n=1 Tax=unclassified Chryseobacterium TaxID=2593645 RepID=UPI0023583E96|nr:MULTISPECIES: GNAT family N-acetyltransferase [unclassified Chryseobacterium]MDC8104930.1 GNAT family N-acetyltransferase [Chryseobacterium sp. B21-037]MDQ1805261.1 GNAT family N-acetyltransferase [Chryseobacterium sp. CKR4-1]WBV58419.1 GNAT family N-acetyltransferase [Chryseobacterium daecheongense]
MTEIKKLEKLISDPTVNWGLNGYETDTIFVVSAIAMGNIFEFSLREKKQHYKKNWETGPDEINDLNEVIKQGHSFGAFINGELVGWLIAEFREWNNSFYIENILISEKFRGQDIGKQLIKKANREARDLNCRIVELETQNTNYPAIKFYLRAGFSFTGINTKLYNDSTETAIYMSFDVL